MYRTARQKNYKQAISCFDATTALKPDTASVYFLLADSYYQYHRENNDGTTDLLDGAEEAVNQGLEIRSNDAPAHGLHGSILDAKKKYQEAMAEYRKAIQLDSKTSVYWVKLALTQEKLNDSTGAIESYKSALAVNPKDTTALYFLGVLYEKLGKSDEAIEAIEKQKSLESLDEETKQRLKLLKEKRNPEQKQKQPKSKAVGKP